MNSYDTLALRALLDSNKARGQKTLSALSAHAAGEHVCQNCGSTGPHDVQVSMGEPEFWCQDCGMVGVVPVEVE